MKRKLERSSSTQGRKLNSNVPQFGVRRITGKVAPSSTTLSRAGGPFSGKKFVTFLYENALSKVSGGTNVVTVQVKRMTCTTMIILAKPVISSRCTMTRF